MADNSGDGGGNSPRDPVPPEAGVTAEEAEPVVDGGEGAEAGAAPAESGAEQGEEAGGAEEDAAAGEVDATALEETQAEEGVGYQGNPTEEEVRGGAEGGAEDTPGGESAEAEEPREREEEDADEQGAGEVAGVGVDHEGERVEDEPAVDPDTNEDAEPDPPAEDDVANEESAEAEEEQRGCAEEEATGEDVSPVDDDGDERLALEYEPEAGPEVAEQYYREAAAAAAAEEEAEQGEAGSYGGSEGDEEGEDYDEDYDEEEDDEDEEEDGIFGSDGAMDPNHPLLARAQAALKEQLLEAQGRLSDELREKRKGLSDAKVQREAIGVELYGVQQQLAKLQLGLERTHESYNMVNRIRQQVEEELDMIRQVHGDVEAETQDEQFRAQKFQEELDKLAATLKQIESYNQEMKDEIAVTRRQTYVAEEHVQRREKEKKDQDYLIDNLQETLKNLHQELSLYTAQLEAQKRETLAAKETLTEAEDEMENIHFEKKQLVQQWQGTLKSVQRRDEALQAVQDAIYEQQQQDMTMDNEMEGYRRDIVKEQLKNEQLTSILAKVEGESEFLMKNIATLREKHDRLQDNFAKLQKSLEQTEEGMKRTEMELKVLASEKNSLDQAIFKCANETKDIENQMLVKLSEQTTAEKAAQKTAKDTARLRKAVKEEEVNLVALQNEMAKLEVDCLNTDAHNGKLRETLKLLDDEVKDKLRTIEQYEVEIRRRNDEIEKRTKEVDLLNRRYEKMTANMEDENTGPLEATINNLQREITQKGVEGKELQRHWLNFQTELVQLLNDNNKMADTVSRLKSEYNVLSQKCLRVDRQYEQQMKEVRNIDSSMTRMHNDLSRLNSHIAKNSELQGLLANDNFNLENRIMSELREMEEEASRLESNIEDCKSRKKDVLAEVVEVERQIMLWERKIQLQREMMEAIDPRVGEDVVGAMQKEIHRMELRYGELMRLQERLVGEMERGIGKRSVIGLKGRATQSKVTADMTEQQLGKACADLKRSIRETEKERSLAEQRIVELEAVHRELLERVQDTVEATQEVQSREEDLKVGVDSTLSEKHKMLLYTAHQQRMCKRLEDVIAGKQRRHAVDPAAVDEELNAALEQQEKIRVAIDSLRSSAPELDGRLDAIMHHAQTRSM